MWGVVCAEAPVAPLPPDPALPIAAVLRGAGGGRAPHAAHGPDPFRGERGQPAPPGSRNHVARTVFGHRRGGSAGRAAPGREGEEEGVKVGARRRAPFSPAGAGFE